jgi:hypothetical protein
MTGKSSKSQHPSSSETSSSKLQDAHLAGLKATEFWDLVFEASLELEF